MTDKNPLQTEPFPGLDDNISDLNARILLGSNILMIAEQLENKTIEPHDAAMQLRKMANENTYQLSLDEIEIDFEETSEPLPSQTSIISQLLGTRAKNASAEPDPLEEAISWVIKARDKMNAYTIAGNNNDPLPQKEYHEALSTLRKTLINHPKFSIEDQSCS